MSKSENRIRSAAAEAGVNIRSLVWEPLSNSVEMIGRMGGWEINGISCGHNANEAIAFIRRDPRTVHRGTDTAAIKKAPQ